MPNLEDNLTNDELMTVSTALRAYAAKIAAAMQTQAAAGIAPWHSDIWQTRKDALERIACVQEKLGLDK